MSEKRNEMRKFFIPVLYLTAMLLVVFYVWNEQTTALERQTVSPNLLTPRC